MREPNPSGRIAAVACLFLLASACGGSSSTDPGGTTPTPPQVTVGESLASGEAKLQTGMATLSTSDLLAAANAFRAAASAASVDPTATQAQKDEASFFGAAALLAVVADPSSSTAATGTLETFGSLLDAYGLGGSALDRAHLDTIRFVDCTASGCTLKTFPPNSPNSRDVQAFLLLKAGGALQGVAAALGNVSPSFQHRLTVRNTVIEFDQTDALALQALAHALLGLVQVQRAYDLGIDVDALQAALRPGMPALDGGAFLAANPSLGTLTDASQLTAARASFLAAIASARAGVASLRAETDDQANDVLKLARTACTFGAPPTYGYSCTTTYNASADLDGFLASLDQAATIIGATGPVTVSGVLVDPTRFFAGIDLRSKLPTAWNAGPRGNLPGPFPDVTFGGLFVDGLPRANLDANGDGSPDWLANLRWNFRLPRL